MRVTTKGQVTIPIEIRKFLNIEAGSEIEFVIGEDDQVFIVPKEVENPPQNRFTKFRGISSVNLSTDEIMALTREQ